MQQEFDVEETSGADQLCIGGKAGIMGAVHPLHELFEENRANGWGVLLVMPAMLSVPSIGLLPYGMYMYYGLEVPASCLTLTEA